MSVFSMRAFQHVSIVRPLQYSCLLVSMMSAFQHSRQHSSMSGLQHVSITAFRQEYAYQHSCIQSCQHSTMSSLVQHSSLFQHCCRVPTNARMPIPWLLLPLHHGFTAFLLMVTWCHGAMVPFLCFAILQFYYYSSILLFANLPFHRKLEKAGKLTST